MVTAFLASSSSSATISTSTGNYRSNSENPPPHHDDSPKPHRSPLAPSVEKDNAAPKRPRSKDVSSRYLAPSPTSYSTATVTPPSRSSSSSPLFPSPTVAQRCSVSPALNRNSVEKRSQSVSRVKPLTPRTDPQAENSASARVQYSQTRSLSVSFQGEPFFYKTNPSPFRLALVASDFFLPPPSSSSTLQSEPGLMRKLSVTNPSVFRRPIRSPSLANYMATPSRGMASPLSVRTGINVTVSPSDQPANAPSIISFAAEVRRSKRGENRIEKAHTLRLLNNQYFQWRFVNAKITATLLSKKVTAEKNIYDACITTSNLRDSVSFKSSKLQIMMDNLKLTSVLEGQITYLDEWSLMDTEHSKSLRGVVEALKATTLRLPIVHGAKAYIQDLKHAVGSAAEVMQVIGSSVCSMLSMVEGAKSIISEIAKVAVEERSLLNQSKDLLSAIAAMHVAQCSLHSHIMQATTKIQPYANSEQILCLH